MSLGRCRPAVQLLPARLSGLAIYLLQRALPGMISFQPKRNTLASVKNNS
jgi:hypothetical protein